MKEIMLTEMNSTKSVHLHTPDLPGNSNGNTAIPTSAFSPGKEKKNTLRVRSGLKSHKQDVVRQSLGLQNKAKSPIVNVNGL